MTIFFNSNGKFKSDDMLNFSKGMYYLLRGNVNIIDALNIISLGYDLKRKAKILDVKSKIQRGRGLEVAFKELSDDREFLQMIKIGENTGNLVGIFENVYKKYEFKAKIKGEVKALSIYPSLVIMTAFIILFILLKIVVPKFMVIYGDMRQELPNITKFVINLSDFINKYWLFLIIFNFIFLYMLKKYVEKKRENFEKILLKIKIIGKMFKEIKVLNFTQNMYVLLKSKITLIDALAISNGGNEGLFQIEMKNQIVKLKKGEEITKVLKNSSFFDKEYISFLKIGENTGNMEEVFFNLMEIYSTRVSERIKLFLKILEPMSILFIGVLVGFIVFAVMMPIFQLAEGI